MNRYLPAGAAAPVSAISGDAVALLDDPAESFFTSTCSSCSASQVGLAFLPVPLGIAAMSLGLSAR